MRLVEFVARWLDKFPEYRSNELYLSSESCDPAPAKLSPHRIASHRIASHRIASLRIGSDLTFADGGHYVPMTARALLAHNQRQLQLGMETINLRGLLVTSW